MPINRIRTSSCLCRPHGSGKTAGIPAAAGAIRDAGRTGGGARTVARTCLADRKRIQVDERPFKAMSCYGGRPAMDEHRTMRALTPCRYHRRPGRMNDHLRKQNFDTRFVTILVIDEFDKCLESGFTDEMAEIIGQLPALKKRVLLSANGCRGNPAVHRSGRGESSPQVVKLNFLSGETVSGRLDLQKVISPEKTSWRHCTGCFVRWATVLHWYS